MHAAANNSVTSFLSSPEEKELFENLSQYLECLKRKILTQSTKIWEEENLNLKVLCSGAPFKIILLGYAVHIYIEPLKKHLIFVCRNKTEKIVVHTRKRKDALFFALR